jgi:hypothetical protein
MRDNPGEDGTCRTPLAAAIGAHITREYAQRDHAGLATTPASCDWLSSRRAFAFRTVLDVPPGAVRALEPDPCDRRRDLVQAVFFLSFDAEPRCQLALPALIARLGGDVACPVGLACRGNRLSAATRQRCAQLPEELPALAHSRRGLLSLTDKMSSSPA